MIVSNDKLMYLRFVGLCFCFSYQSVRNICSFCF